MEGRTEKRDRSPIELVPLAQLTAAMDCQQVKHGHHVQQQQTMQDCHMHSYNRPKATLQELGIRGWKQAWL